MDFEPAKAELAADVVEPSAIALGKFPLRALLEPADCNDDEAHEAGSDAHSNARCTLACAQADFTSAIP
jgi:hypothetical protein